MQSFECILAVVNPKSDYVLPYHLIFIKKYTVDTSYKFNPSLHFRAHFNLTYNGLIVFYTKGVNRSLYLSYLFERSNSNYYHLVKNRRKVK